MSPGKLWAGLVLLANLCLHAAVAEDMIDSQPRGTLYGKVERFDQQYVMLSMGDARIVLPRTALADSPELHDGVYVTAMPTFRDLIAPVPDWNRRHSASQPMEQVRRVEYQ